jgi:hypothetical protein
MWKRCVNFLQESSTFPLRRLLLQLFEQQVTSSQHLSHFLRQVKGRPHTAQVLDGKFSFLTVLDGEFPFLTFIFDSSSPFPPRPSNLVDE